MKKSEDRKFDPPDHLSDRSKALWHLIVPRRAKSSERLTILQTAFECLDRADQAKAILNAEGLTTKTLATGTIHCHPMVKVEQESRRQFVRIWDSLSLNFAPNIDGVVGNASTHHSSVGLPSCVDRT